MRGRAVLLDGASIRLFLASSWPAPASAALIVLFYLLLGRAIDPVSIDLRHFSLHPWSVPRITLLAGSCATTRPFWGATLPARAAAAPWRIPRSAPRSASARARALDCAVGRRGGRSPRATGRFPGSVWCSSAAACAIAALARARLELVPPHDGRRPHLRAVPGVPDPGAAALSIDELLRGARDPRADRHRAYAVQAQNHVQTLQRGRSRRARKSTRWKRCRTSIANARRRTRRRRRPGGVPGLAADRAGARAPDVGRRAVRRGWERW